jgi:hypothetical protein
MSWLPSLMFIGSNGGSPNWKRPFALRAEPRGRAIRLETDGPRLSGRGFWLQQDRSGVDSSICDRDSNSAASASHHPGGLSDDPIEENSLTSASRASIHRRTRGDQQRRACAGMLGRSPLVVPPRSRGSRRGTWVCVVRRRQSGFPRPSRADHPRRGTTDQTVGLIPRPVEARSLPERLIGG